MRGGIPTAIGCCVWVFACWGSCMAGQGIAWVIDPRNRALIYGGGLLGVVIGFVLGAVLGGRAYDASGGPHDPTGPEE